MTDDAREIEIDEDDDGEPLAPKNDPVPTEEE